MKEIIITSLSQFFDTIEKLRSYYPPYLIFNNPTVNPFLYRGLSDIEYKLIPSVFRKTDQIVNEHTIVNDKYLTWSKEESLLRAFIHEASRMINIPPDDLFRWAEYAQHYGVPTRFLDWSSNPLVALYFACRDRIDKDGVVWVLHAINYKRYIGKNVSVQEDKTVKEIITDVINQKSEFPYPLVYTPYYVDERMSAQKSFFLVWGSRMEAFEELIGNDYYMDIPENEQGYRTYGQAQQEDILFKIIVKSDRKQPLIHELEVVGTSEKSLFPGLDGIGRYIERQYRFNYDEMLSS